MIRLIRQGLLLVALALALPAEAATRYWSLQGVVFEDGTTLAGSFGYDDVANEVTTWNIRVQGGSGYQPFTLTPGNSNPVNGGVGITGGFVYFFQFVAMEGTDAERWLWLSVKFRLDGSVASQPLYLVDPANPAGFYYAFDPAGEAIRKDSDMFIALDVLARQVGVVGIFSDWPGTVTYYANCMGLR